MAVNLTNADKALKTVYLDVVSEQLNGATNPLLAKIKQSTEDVWGKEVRKLAIYGVNGGVGAGTEEGALPKAHGNNYGQFVSTLKNLYGTIEITDKAIRASENNSGAFVNLLNAEMEGLVKASSFNFGRMLFGDGSGILTIAYGGEEDGRITVESVKNIIEGMTIDIRYNDTEDIISGLGGIRVLSVDRENNSFKTNARIDEIMGIGSGCYVTIQGSYKNEITGIKKIFDKEAVEIYGINKADNKWLTPYVKENVGEIDELTLQTALDSIEEKSGSAVDFIVCSWGVRRALQKVFSENKIRVESVNLDGGFKAITYNGIPIVADRFCPEGTMYLLNTKDFTLHQLCDWQWLSGDDGKILRQIPGKPVYTATLVKYAELMCAKPYGQGMLSGIIEK